MASMAAANRLKVALEEGKAPAMGCWQMIPGSNVSRVLARTGVDWVLVDCEHGNMDGEWGLLYFCFSSPFCGPSLSRRNSQLPLYFPERYLELRPSPSGSMASFSVDEWPSDPHGTDVWCRSLVTVI
jgi:hypothetical protein